MVKTVLPFLLLGLAAPAMARETPATTPLGDGAKTVCKRQALTGTRFAKKICFTRAEWGAKAEADRRALAEMTGNQVQRDTGRD